MSTSFAIGFYGYWKYEKIKSRRDACAYPHTIPAIGFVLNPHKERCTYWVGDGISYPVNSYGLRGKEISIRDKDQRSGKKRVLIVGDSWVWGWRLSDEKMLASQLAAILDQKLGASKYEFVTVAMPAWNVKSEYAFLDSHFYLLEPDFVIWVMTQNDVIDVPGVIPPGYPVTVLSPQTPNGSPFIEEAYTLYPMPFVRERWEENIGLVNQIKARYRVPILGMFVHMPPAFVSYVTERVKTTFPVILDAPFLTDKRWGIAPNDSHPTAWANRTMALGFLNQMIEMDFLPPLNFTTEEKAYIREWQLASETEVKKAQHDSYIRTYVDRTPWEYPDTDKAESSGSIPVNVLNDTGVLFLNVGEDHEFVEVSLKVHAGVLRASRAVTLSVRDRGGNESSITRTIEEPVSTFQIPLPRSREHSLIEVRWKFDFLTSAGPEKRDVGVLLAMKGKTAPEAPR